MYKDVWKKFGTKILMVLCSVLLLGGVAIAVPRLQARTITSLDNDQLIDLGTVATEKVDGSVLNIGTHTSGAAIKISGTYQYNGKLNVPKALTIQDNNGDEYPLQEGVDYEVVATSDTDPNVKTDMTTAGTQIVTIRGLANSKLLLPNKECKIQYKISKKMLPNVTINAKNTSSQTYADYSKIGNEILISNIGDTITADKFSITSGEWNGDLSTTQYKVVDANGDPYKVNALGQSAKPLYLQFTNYYFGKDTENNTIDSWRQVTLPIKKDISTLSVKINGVDAKDYMATIEPTSLEVLDGTTKVSCGFTNTALSADKTYREIRIDPSSNDYGGYWIDRFPVSFSTLRFIAVDNKFQTALDYIEEVGDRVPNGCEPDSGYKFTPNQIRATINGKEEIFKAGEFELEKDDWCIVPRQNDTVNPIPGATAGIVRVKVTLTKSGFADQTGYLYYQVMRDIKFAQFENKAIETDDYIYQVNKKHPRIACVYFTDAPGYTEAAKDTYLIRENDDYSISYSLDKWKSGKIEQGNNTDAGIVYMKITGTLGENKPAAGHITGGYYGSVTGDFDHPGLSYNIEPKPLDDNCYINFVPDLYELGCTEQTVINGGQLLSKTDESIRHQLISLKDKDRWDDPVTIYLKDKSEVTDWTKKEPGEYEMSITFTGNYSGTVKGKFKVEPYNSKFFEFTFGTCPECGAAPGANHVYTGDKDENGKTIEHKPPVTSLIYTKDGQNVQIDKKQWKSITYTNNTYVGTATVQIQLDNSVATGNFIIDPQELYGNQISLTKDDDFTGSYNDQKHDYCGPVNFPTVRTLNLKVTGSSRKEMVLEIDKDCTLEGLYAEGSNTPVRNASDIETGVKYRYKVSAFSDNFVNANDLNHADDVYTGYFTFSSKPIDNRDKITCTIAPKTPYIPNESAENYKSYIETNLQVWDDDFKQYLSFDKGDYTISNVDTTSIAVDGTVTFMVTGGNCYYLDRIEKLFVGDDITLAKYVEKTQPEKSINRTGVGVGTADLVGPYSKKGEDYDVPFVEDGTESQNKIHLRYYSGSKYIVLNSTEHYDVKIEKSAVPEDPDNGSGKQKGRLTITGKNGYYGTVTVTFTIDKININPQDPTKRYRIVFLDEDGNVTKNPEYMYTGDKINPRIKVLAPDESDTDPGLVKGDDYTVFYDRDINATEGYTENYKKAYVKVTGIYGYTGELEAYFTILKRPIYTEITEDGVTKHVIDTTAFSMTGWEPKNEYIYTPYTLVGQTETPGVLPQVKLLFNGKELTEGNSGDYSISYKNQYDACDSADQSVPYTDKPTVVITASNNSNFKGYFEEVYTIKPVTLSDEKQCTVTIDGKRWAFTGNEILPKVTVTLKRIDGTTYTFGNANSQRPEGQGHDYEVDYRDNIFVSIGDADSDTRSTGTRVIVRELRKDNNKVSGNCVGQVVKPFIIYGEFQPKTPSASKNSKMAVTGGSIDYSPNSTKGGCTITFYQRKAGFGSFDDPTKENAKEYLLKEGADYTVSVPNIVGIQDGRITSTAHWFEGGTSCKITIVGNLEKDTEVKGPGVIAYSPGKEFKLQDKITVVCGGRTLKYGVDYKFDREPTMNLGTDNEIRIIPFSDDITYLINSKLITYEVKSGLDNIELPDIIDAEEGAYTYAHGEEVIKEENVVVQMGDTILQNNVDYTISIDDKVTVGTHTITIEGKGKYTGTFTKKFKIKPYNLADGYANKEIAVNYDKSTTYTGGTVFPAIQSITAVAPSGDKKTLSPGDDTKQGDYELVAGGQGDHINWTSGDVKPNFIIGGVGNYEGEITLEYSINRKDIGEPEVTETALEDIYYNNGKDITPVPQLHYEGRDLAGVLFSGNADDYINWSDYTKHFSYQYSTRTDLTSVGEKTIRVRGIGNFTGERIVTYRVIPLDLSVTEVVFINDTPVYDGQPQQPAFQLKYNGEIILEYTGKEVVSMFIKEPKVEFIGDHTNVTKTAMIRISAGENDNYTNKKEVTFTILPASLANHTKFMYRPENSNENVDLRTYKLNYPFSKGNSVMPNYAGEEDAAELKETQLGIYYDDVNKANHGAFLKGKVDYEISYQYVEPDTDDVEIREEYRNPEPPLSYAGKVKVTITGVGNYIDSASFWYFIGKDISKDASFTMNPTTAIYNSQKQYPNLKVTGVNAGEYLIGRYKDEVALKNLIEEKDFVNAGTYYIRIEGDPTNGTYATEPKTLTYTITPRAFSNNLVIDGFKREYSYTGYDICPVGISVTDYIDNTKYRLTEDVDYTLTYTNNLNAGTAYINVEGKNNFSGKATANFMITSSTISSGGTWGSNSFLDQGTGEISGATAVAPGNVSLSMDTVDAMYYTGSPVYPKVSIAGMTENIDYTVTFANNVDVGTAVATITGIGNNNGTITKNFRIIAQLSKCTISPIPAQQYTGSEVKPALTVKCGSNILMEGVDYAATYSNNINIGTATVTLRALNNANYTGTTSTTFSIGNDVGGFIISGYAPSYAYTGKAITPGVVVETGSRTLVQGTDYTVSYANNVNAGTATITVTGIGRYSGTQTANFVIEPKSMQSLDTSDIADRTYTGDAYTPDITVSDGSKVLTKGVDYTVTYTNNTEPGMASVVIKGVGSNYSGTKVVSFKISAVAVKGLKASNVKYNSLKLKWTKQDYADGYQICNSSSKVLKTVTKNSATITGLSAGKTYKYKVRSYIKNADGTRSYGAFSSVLNATTKLKTPTVKVVSKAKGQARISWSKVSGASGYEIYYKKSAGAKYKKLKTVNNANIRVCTVRGMKSGDRAYFRIRAFRNNGSKKVYSSLNPLKVITVK